MSTLGLTRQRTLIETKICRKIKYFEAAEYVNICDRVYVHGGMFIGL